jgi:hypothetical protein
MVGQPTKVTKTFTYTSYNFVEKDPIIDEIRTVYQDSGVNYRWINEHSGVSVGTLTNWFSGSTRRPQAATINAVLRSLGYKLGITRYEPVEQVKVYPQMEQPKPRQAREASMRHVVSMSKFRRGR